jgi:hypothetical protein
LLLRRAARIHRDRRLTLQGQAGTDEAIAIYEVVDNKIGRLTLVRGVKKIRDLPQEA